MPLLKEINEVDPLFFEEGGCNLRPSFGMSLKIYDQDPKKRSVRKYRFAVKNKTKVWRYRTTNGRKLFI